jgi:hypothetical protein
MAKPSPFGTSRARAFCPKSPFSPIQPKRNKKKNLHKTPRQRSLTKPSLSETPLVWELFFCFPVLNKTLLFLLIPLSMTLILQLHEVKFPSNYYSSFKTTTSLTGTATSITGRKNQSHLQCWCVMVINLDCSRGLRSVTPS